MTENNNLKSIIENKKPVELVQEMEEAIEKKEVITATINPNRLWAGISYIGSPDSNIWTELDQNITLNKHRGTSPFNNFCLGCLCSNGDYSGHHPDFNLSQTFHFSSGGKLVLETSESGMQELYIPSKGGVVKFEIQGNKVSLFLEDEKVEQVSNEMTMTLFDEETKRTIRKSKEEEEETINLTEEI